MSELKVAIAQSASSPNIETNCQWVEKAFKNAVQEDAKLIIFPECILCWAKSDITKQEARSLEKWEDTILPLIEKYKIASVWGGVQIKENDKIVIEYMDKTKSKGNSVGPLKIPGVKRF